MLAKRIHEINMAKGFYNPPASKGRRWMLIASELFEAIEGLRENNINPSLDSDPQIIKTSVACEMADAYIRVLDFMEYEKIYVWPKDDLGEGVFDDIAQGIFRISKGLHDAWAVNAYHIGANVCKLRIEELCELEGINLMAFVEWKLDYNSKREYKHGKEW